MRASFWPFFFHFYLIPVGVQTFSVPSEMKNLRHCSATGDSINKVLITTVNFYDAP